METENTIINRKNILIAAGGYVGLRVLEATAKKIVSKVRGNSDVEPVSGLQGESAF